ncbi:DUF3152 domain-containing protein [Nocardioides lentus]|uniref:DUF3152 domain-containing protein n=1 Tax=Nocardioides lentus TaxID=338077 RepID=UPI0031E13549
MPPREPGRRVRGGSHRATPPAPRPGRTTRVVRGVGILAVAGLATGFGPVVPELLDRGPSTVARDTDAPSAAPSGEPAPDAPADALPGRDAPSPSTTPAEEPEAEPAPRPRRVPATGSGVFRVALAAEAPADADLTYTVEVEEGVPFSPRATARTVDRVLGDPRGWRTTAGLELRRTGEASDFRVLVATPATTDLLCAPLATNGEVSCRNGDLVVLNAKRWALGVPDYRGHLRQYRTYLVNHEVGHRLGYGHVECSAPGSPAPVMQQQTYGLDGCTRNAWPTT